MLVNLLAQWSLVRHVLPFGFSKRSGPVNGHSTPGEWAVNANGTGGRVRAVVLTEDEPTRACCYRGAFVYASRGL